MCVPGKGRLGDPNYGKDKGSYRSGETFQQYATRNGVWGRKFEKRFNAEKKAIDQRNKGQANIAATAPKAGGQVAQAAQQPMDNTTGGVRRRATEFGGTDASASGRTLLTGGGSPATGTLLGG